MKRPQDFQDGEVWLMVKLGYTNPPRLLVKRRLQALKVEHTYLRGLGYRQHDQEEKNGTHSQQIRRQWDVQTPTGGMGEAGAHRPQSVNG